MPFLRIQSTEGKDGNIRILLRPMKEKLHPPGEKNKTWILPLTLTCPRDQSITDYFLLSHPLRFKGAGPVSHWPGDKDHRPWRLIHLLICQDHCIIISKGSQSQPTYFVSMSIIMSSPTENRIKEGLFVRGNLNTGSNKGNGVGVGLISWKTVLDIGCILEEGTWGIKADGSI